MRAFSVLTVVMLLLAPSIARAEYITGIPFKNLTTSSPIIVTDHSLFAPNPPNGTFRACISFKNIAPKPASLVTFTFRFDDLLGSPLAEAILPRSGSFGTGIAIEGKMNTFGGNSDSFNNCVNLRATSIAPAVWTVDVRTVTFEGGTSWKKGDPLPGASPVPSPTPLAGATPAPNSSVSKDGAVAVAGTIGGATSTLHGAIAWYPGSRTAFGVSIDLANQETADYTAMSKCMALAPGNAGCTIQVRMTSGNDRCGAIATDDTRYSSARGPDSNKTITVALAALEQQGGTLGSNNIVASVCNK